MLAPGAGRGRAEAPVFLDSGDPGPGKRGPGGKRSSLEPGSASLFFFFARVGPATSPSGKVNICFLSKKKKLGGTEERTVVQVQQASASRESESV